MNFAIGILKHALSIMEHDISIIMHIWHYEYDNEIIVHKLA